MWLSFFLLKCYRIFSNIFLLYFPLYFLLLLHCAPHWSRLAGVIADCRLHVPAHVYGKNNVPGTSHLYS